MDGDKRVVKKILVAAVAFVLVIISAAACGKEEQKQEEKTTQETETETTEEPTETETEPETEPEPEQSAFSLKDGEMYSNLSGQPVSTSIGNRRPIAVAFSNIQTALPQTGISRADIIYEAQVEGGITRLLGIMENYDDLEKIGSVRSARPHYIHFANEYDAIYVHFGQCAYAREMINSGMVDNINGYFAQGNFYRTTDRVAPHNAYTSGAGLNESIQKMYRTDHGEGYVKHFIFADYGTTVDLADGASANTVKPGYANNACFNYSPADNLYYRNEFDAPEVDDMNGQQLAVTNIIFQYCKWGYYDDNYRVNIDLTSGGSGKYITGGKAIDVTWSKGNDGITRYYDLSGKEITLNTGKTWVCIIFDSQTGRVVIE